MFWRVSEQNCLTRLGNAHAIAFGLRLINESSRIRETVRVLSSKIGQRTHYDPAGRVLQQTIQRSTSPAPLAERRYRYDAAGQLSRIEDSRKGGIDYRYDPVGRLIEAISPVAKERFAFDPASNIIDPVRTADTPASRPSPVRPESTLPVEVPKVLGNLLKAYAGMHFEYDARGNLVRKRTPAGEQEYEWDEFNRLLSARVAETSRQSQARYFYDAFGRRIAKEVNGERTVFGWDGDTLAYESDGERGTHYIYEPGTFVPLAQYVAEPVDGIATPEWKATDRYVPEEDPLQKVPERRGGAVLFYYHCDQIGTPQLLTDGDGDVVWEASYKAWGEAREVIARASKAAGIVVRNPLRFQGQQVDDETGLSYNRHRYYDPDAGRFVSRDPIGLRGGVNVYQYVPNPTHWIDPLGLACSPTRRASLREIRRQLGIPMSQQPLSQKMVPLTDSGGAWILGENKQPIMTRELTYQVNGKSVIVQDHSAGHYYNEGGIGDQPSHHNVRPEENTRTGKVDGMDDHYYFDCRNRK